MLPSPPPSAFSFLRPPRNLASQFELTTQSALPDHHTVADLPRAVWRNKRYVLEESLSRKGSKGRKSWIKRHGFFLVEIDTNDSPLSPYWACRLCDAKGQPEFFAAAATSSAADHLRKSHRIFESSQAADPDLSTDESERPKRRRLQYSAVPRARVKMIRELSLGLLINTNVPFSFFSDTFFQQLAWQLDPHLADQIPWSRQSMGRLLDDTYKSKKDEIKQELSDALTKIHLGFDLWTSPNRHAVMAVTAHFLDRQGKHQSRLLALRRQLGCHSGESLAVTLGQVVREWKIEDRVGTVISDNASSNDSCLVNFYGDLDAEMSLADVRARRMRCYGHILNLVARAFLYGEDFESFEAEIADLPLRGVSSSKGSHARTTKHKNTSWRTMRTQGWGSEGGNGRLWEVMTGMEYLLEHLEDRKLFHHAVPDEAGGQDTNSQAELARGRPDRNRQLPARFRDCETDIHPRKSRQGPLSDRGSRQCDDGSGKPSGSLGIDDMGKDHRHYLRLSIMTAWQKLNEYYTKLGDSPLFAASIILHPSLGMNYLEVNWASEEQLVWVRDAKIGLSDYLDRWYHCNRPVDEQQKMIMDTSTSLSVPRTTTEVSVFKQWIKSRTAKTTVMGSELERYLRLEPQETEDPIEWWMAHQGQFPMISQLALDILAIPAMATDCERSFSLAKLTLTTQRLSMTTETLEKLQCLKNWVRHGAVKLGATIGGGEEVQWEIGDVSMEA
uniref:HAT C-terminal dimerisation domain-containing protein n=1 Tax=Fusarium oxysporum (strain Fo5176) TaxID=660025 RepID=A0A0D2YIC8_FUSOF